MSNGRHKILLTNDDGVFAEGLRALERELADVAELFVVAPDRERSGSSHSITLHHPLRAREVEPGRLAVDGTPTDCVNLALNHLLVEHEIRLVVSGINAGLNSGDDVTYSGTCGAVFEASLLRRPGIAFSQDTTAPFDFERAARWARGLVEAVLDEEYDPTTLLNVNFPTGTGEFEGWSLTCLGRRLYHDVIVEKKDPRGKEYYWIAGTPEWKGGERTDQAAIDAGRVSVTPLHLDLTDFDALDRPEAWHARLD